MTASSGLTAIAHYTRKRRAMKDSKVEFLINALEGWDFDDEVCAGLLEAMRELQGSMAIYTQAKEYEAIREQVFLAEIARLKVIIGRAISTCDFPSDGNDSLSLVAEILQEALL